MPQAASQRPPGESSPGHRLHGALSGQAVSLPESNEQAEQYKRLVPPRHRSPSPRQEHCELCVIQQPCGTLHKKASNRKGYPNPYLSHSTAFGNGLRCVSRPSEV